VNAWFGEPWWSYVCYDDAGRLMEEQRVPFPEGRSCLYCAEPFAEGDSGTEMLCGRADGTWTVEYAHKECQMRAGLGSVAHLEGRCTCHGGGQASDPQRTPRQEALAVWEWVQAHGVRGR
jgi:hypothetical protein